MKEDLQDYHAFALKSEYNRKGQYFWVTLALCICTRVFELSKMQPAFILLFIFSLSLSLIRAVEFLMVKSHEAQFLA